MFYNIYNSATTAIMVDETGQLCIFSKDAKKIWSGQLEVVDWKESTSASNTERAQPLIDLAVNNRSFLEDIGIESDMIDSLAKGFDKD